MKMIIILLTLASTNTMAATVVSKPKEPTNPTGSIAVSESENEVERNLHGKKKHSGKSKKAKIKTEATTALPDQFVSK